MSPPRGAPNHSWTLHGLGEAGNRLAPRVARRSSPPKAEGDVLFARVAAGEQVNVTVGPRTGGPTLAQITPGSGLIVHAMGAPAAGALATKAYPDLFGTAGWLEVSRLRDIMFVCFPALQDAASRGGAGGRPESSSAACCRRAAWWLELGACGRSVPSER